MSNTDPTNGKPLPRPADVTDALNRLKYVSRNGVTNTATELAKTMSNQDSQEELKKDAQVRKFMAKYRYQYSRTMLDDLTALINAHTSKAIEKALHEAKRTAFEAGLRTFEDGRYADEMVQRQYDLWLTNQPNGKGE